MLSWEYPPHVEGGMGRHVAELCPALVEQNVEVHVITPIAEVGSTITEVASVNEDNGITVHRVFAPQIGSNADIYTRAVAVNKVIEDYTHQLTCKKNGLIHVHDWLTSFSGITLKNSLSCPLVTTIHATERGRSRGHVNNDLQRSIENAERDLISQSSQIIVCSHYMFNEVKQFFNSPVSKLTIVPNGVNIEDLSDKPSQDLTAFRAKYAAPDEAIVFSVVRLVYEKGIHVLLQATQRILAENPKTRIIIAGKGPETSHLKQQAQILGIANRVNFVGFISDEERDLIFRVADCAVFPSLYEPFGIVALEAMALGCPIVVSDVGGFSEVVKHKETGITTYPNDANSVAWGILYSLTHREWAKESAIKARQAVEELFNWNRIAGLTIDFYKKVLNK